MSGDPDTSAQIPRPAPLWLQLTESAVITAGVPLIGYWLSPQDPFFVDAGFPWLMLAPLLVALRYGINAGALSVFMLIGAMALGWTYGFLKWESFPLLYSVGLLVTVMLVGEFGSVWNRRLGLLSAMNDYRQHRLSEFTRHYNLLKQSHDHLEQRLAANSTSLRGCLISVRKELAAAQETLGPLFDLGPLILRLFAHYGSLQVASIHEVDGSGGVRTEALASLGEAKPLRPGLRLVDEALKRGGISYIDVEREPNHEMPEPLMAAMPLTDIDNRVWALVCVERIPFRAYTRDNLQRMAVMAEYLGDMLRAKSLASEARDTDEQIFMVQLERCVRDAREHGLPARVFAFHFVNPQTAFQLVAMFMEHVRGLDLSWLMSNRDGESVLLVLLPLTGDIAGGEYVASLEREVKERYGFSNLELAGVQMHDAGIERRDLPVDVLLRICDPCNVELADQMPDEDGLDALV